MSIFHPAHIFTDGPTVLVSGVGARPDGPQITLEIPASPSIATGRKGCVSASNGEQVMAVDRRVGRLYRSALEVISGVEPTPKMKDRLVRLMSASADTNCRLVPGLEVLNAIFAFPEFARERFGLVRPEEPILFGTVQLCGAPDRIVKQRGDRWEREYAESIEWLEDRRFIVRGPERKLSWRLGEPTFAAAVAA